MRKIFRGNRKSQRVIIDGASHLRNEDLDIDVYMRYDDNTQFVRVQAFVGKTVKPDINLNFRTMEIAEQRIEDLIKREQERADYKAQLKLDRKSRTESLKAELIPGAIVRCSFSYNMTFNKFYSVISNKGNTYQLEVLGTDWVDGDIGWTGNVKAGERTGKFIEGKFTSKGLKIDRLYGDVIDANDTFYENHLD